MAESGRVILHFWLRPAHSRFFITQSSLLCASMPSPRMFFNLTPMHVHFFLCGVIYRTSSGMLILITLSIPTHASKITSRKPSLTVQSLSNLCLFISKPNHSLDIAMCSLSLDTNASCLYSKSPQINWASLANKNGVFSSSLPHPSPCSLSPKTQDIPKPSFLCCNTQNAPPW